MRNSKRQVTRDTIISIDGNLYSIPNGILAHVAVGANSHDVATEHEGQQLALHPLITGRGKRQVLY